VRAAAAVFFEYCKRGATGSKDIRGMFNLSAREFVAFCKARASQLGPPRPSAAAAAASTGREG
jgi:hypothetical protein